jgi:hypothetical protein
MIDPSEDAFGAALLDYLEGRDVPELGLETDEGETGPAMHPEWFFRSFDRWEWWDRKLLPLVEHGPVLDLGAGAGRASLYLHERGLAVTAVDASPAAVEVCRRRVLVMSASVRLMIHLPISGGQGCCCCAETWAWAALGKGIGGCSPGWPNWLRPAPCWSETP